MYIRCAVMEDHREWEKARQVVEAISRIMVGDGGADDPTPEKPVVETSSMSRTAAGSTKVSVKKIVDFEHERRVQELVANGRKVDAEGPEALARLKKKWAEEAERG